MSLNRILQELAECGIVVLFGSILIAGFVKLCGLL